MLEDTSTLNCEGHVSELSELEPLVDRPKGAQGPMKDMKFEDFLKEINFTNSLNQE